MARTWVATDDLAEGTLPPVCARTGRPTDHTVRTAFARAPVPVVPRVVPFALVRPLASATVEARVPLLREVDQRVRRLAAVRDGALAAAVVALVAAFVVGEVVVLWLAALCAVVAVVWTVVGVLTAIGGRMDDTGDWVELSNVSPSFAERSDERYADAEADDDARADDHDDRPGTGHDELGGASVPAGAPTRRAPRARS